MSDQFVAASPVTNQPGHLVVAKQGCDHQVATVVASSNVVLKGQNVHHESGFEQM